MWLDTSVYLELKNSEDIVQPFLAKCRFDRVENELYEVEMLTIWAILTNYE